MVSIDDHAPEANDREAPTVDLDLGRRESGRGNQTALIAQGNVALLPPVLERRPGAIERIELVALQLGALLVSQGT
jgi:hypothetical protein